MAKKKNKNKNKKKQQQQNQEENAVEEVVAPTEETPADDATMTETGDAVVEESAPDAKEPATEEAAKEEADVPAEETPAPVEPAVEEVAAAVEAPDEPVAEEAVAAVEEPDEPATEEPAAVVEAPDEPAAEEPAPEEPKESAVEEPDEPVVEEPDEPVAEEPAAAVVEEPDEPVAEDPADVAEEPVAEAEPPAVVVEEEPEAKEEPVAAVVTEEEPIAEEPAVEEATQEPEPPVVLEEPIAEEVSDKEAAAAVVVAAAVAAGVEKPEPPPVMLEEPITEEEVSDKAAAAPVVAAAAVAAGVEKPEPPPVMLEEPITEEGVSDKAAATAVVAAAAIAAGVEKPEPPVMLEEPIASIEEASVADNPKVVAPKAIMKDASDALQTSTKSFDDAPRETLKFVVEALRKNLGAKCDSTTLLAFLRWKPDVTKAADRFRAHLDWRSKNAFAFDDKPLLLSKDKKLLHLIETGVVIADKSMVAKDGSAVLITRVGMAPTADVKDVCRAVLYCVDRILERQESATIIHDLKNISRKQVSAISALMGTCIGKFPLRVKSELAVNAPWWLSNRTGTKVMTAKLASRSKFVKKLTELKTVIHPKNLLKEFTGDRVYDGKAWAAGQKERESNPSFASLTNCTSTDGDLVDDDLSVEA